MSIIPDELVATLREHAKVQRLDERARDAIQSWLMEEGSLPHGCDPTQVRAEFASRWLCFEPELVSYPYIDTRLHLYAGICKIGYYRLITTMDGEADDDYFVLENGDETR